MAIPDISGAVEVVKSGVGKVSDTLKDISTSAQAGAKEVYGKDTKFESLYSEKYKNIFLQYPLNLESGEENHWVRFDIQELQSASIKEPKERTVGVDVGSENILSKTALNVSELNAELTGDLGGAYGPSGLPTGGEIAGRIAKKAGSAALGAVQNVAKGYVNELLNPLGAIGTLGKSLLSNIGFGVGQQSRGMGSIMLYSPHTRSDNLRYNWKNQEIGISGTALDRAGGSVLQAAQTAASGSSEQVQAAVANRNLFIKSLMAIVAGGAVGNETLADVQRRAAGVAINPRLEMFFQQVEFRTFTFDFRLAPRNSGEAKQIREIVNLFKYASAPALVPGTAGILFAYPNVFDIEFFNQDQTHKIARSALTSVAVNHSAAGVNSTFYDDYPVETSLSLTFTELEIMHKDKIDQGY